MIYEQKYIQETENLINFYKDKKANSIKEYILTCHNYIDELRNLDTIELFTELEYERAFNEVLSLVEETFRPDQLYSVINGANLRLLDDEFIVYILGVQKSLKKPIKWNLLIYLQYNFSMAEIQFNIETGFSKDFTQFAIEKIKLTELFKLKS